MDQPYHIPALLEEAIEGLDIKSDGIYVDATFGGGGHSGKIIESIGHNGKLFGFDQDMDAYSNRLENDNFIFVHSNFKYIRNFLRFHGINKIDGLLADLGVSFHHFDASERGFTFRNDTRLDMRMNPEAVLDAEILINASSPDDLKRILKVYGEVDNSGSIVSRIVKERNENRIKTTQQFIDVISPVLDPKREKKELAKIFQAIRIAVNNELGALETLLNESVELLKPGGRLVIISYHSLEDRMVKNFMKTGNIDGKTVTDIYGTNPSPFRMVTSKPIVPSEKEIEENPRSRSAKLRIAIRK